ncbi:LAME_0A05490g1_1 [Lachancea meyersii CBS 8951]|uniref:GPI-anchored wall transfer protein n=1 Tax=Lachancea meyersii CBS 8951 TaxID=1266667 RepID=A0A1G4IPR1_9SACH|nr:LAME_0A05490g1_1 [Lachancea meyersii CBS 8951]
MSDLKQRKEDFVSGLTGGSIEEINCVTSVAICAYFCWNLINSTTSNAQVSHIIDFLLNWGGLLLSITTYSDSPLRLHLFILVPSVIYWLGTRSSASAVHQGRSKNSRLRDPSKAEQREFELVKRPFITAYRGSMMVVTVLAILAVDFQIFPRRFAKVETWGSSLMDLGVGSFVFSNGLVSSRVLFKAKQSGQKPNFAQKLVGAIKSSGSILVLGLLRLYFVKNLEYQEHVTEYGVHWNFFITLALLPLAMIPLDAIIEYVPRVLVALAMSTVYDFFMIFKERFLSFLIDSPRNSLINANREGIFSFVGYCSIFLWGQTTGFYTLGSDVTKNNLYIASISPVTQVRKLSGWDKLTSKRPLSGLLIWSFLSMSAAQIVFAWHPFNISRRFANFPYVIWVVSYNTGALTLYCLVDTLFGNQPSREKISPALEALNSNGLFLFLLANISTGLINMTIPTIDMSPTWSFLILLAYASFLASVAAIMLKRGLSIKL